MTDSSDSPLLGLLGQPEDELSKMTAWSSAEPLEDSPDRIDCDGRVIRWADYGKTTAYGWEIGHATPIAVGGLDVGGNLRARHWLGSRIPGGLLGGLFRPGISGAIQAARTS
jgi:hypothetical protein